jgi:hypothetical protein
MDPEQARTLREYLELEAVRADDEVHLARQAAGQSKLGSVVETAANVGSGYLLALITQPIIYSYFGLEINIGQSAAVALVFTTLSLARSFVVRRIFNAL